MISARISKSLPTKMTETIHKGSVPSYGEPRLWRCLSFCRSRILTRVRLFCCLAGYVMAATAQAHEALPGPSATTLAQELAQRDSATAALQQHCATPITAHLLDRKAPATLQQDARLALNAIPTEKLEIRHVQLLCGGEVWSEAWNLYLPDRLTSQARRTLANGHTPFGKAIGEGNFSRQRLNSRFTDLPPGIMLENRAILHRRTDGRNFAYLIERYTDDALDIRAWRETSSDAVPRQEPASAP